jgi:hypothetical protein
MQILKNKHIVLAMFVTPILAIIAYFATDYLVAEKPGAAEAGSSYPLAARPDCRYTSGHCTLENGEVEVQLTAERSGDAQVDLTLQSDLPLQKAVAAFVERGDEAQPVTLEPVSQEGRTWKARLPLANPGQSRLRLSIVLAGSIYYAETSAVFVDYETSFSRDNFAN